ncbi:MAG: serine/threonine protein kinase [Planctomycetales bacterium]|nr:serine/threonine protein kinase [Planctomycetales bacterium]
MSKETDDFLDLVRRSQLVEDDQLNKFLGDLATRLGNKLPAKKDALAAAMVEAELITEWQSEKLLAGKHKGFILGKYKLLRHLGKGGMSQVYVAEHMLMKRKVAIKVLPQNRVEDSSYLDRFRIEARAAARLDDPNIVRVYDIDHHDKTHYLVMEFVQGSDLHVLIKEKGPLPYIVAADYIAQVARGLAHAHEMGLVHRDIKPANCLVDHHQVVKILDMGLARLVDDEASLTMENNENVLGTADYLAPEQALNSHKADQRADIYSLGCTLYFLLTGHPPFPDGTISERLLKHQVEKAPSIFNDRPDAPPGLVNICNRMMAKKPEDRYQTATEVAERLTEWLAERGHTVGAVGKKDGGSGSGSDGVGSDVFKRFSAGMSNVGSVSSTGPASGSGVGRTQMRRPTATKARPAASSTNEEIDLTLAPLEDDDSKQSVKARPAAAKKPTTPDSPSSSSSETVSGSLSDTQTKQPRRSLIEEEFEAAKAARGKPPQQRRPEDFNPLQPPGYTGPSYGPPPWIFVLIGVGVVALVGIIAAIALS